MNDGSTSGFPARRANHPCVRWTASPAVKPLSKKYSSLPNIRNILYAPYPAPPKGRCATSTTRGGMRWTLMVLLTKAFEADGEAVWSWHLDAGVKLALRSAGDGGQKARAP